MTFPNIQGWQQSTGLKDRAGKEIYEGDIVKWRIHPKSARIGEVAWDEKAAAPRVKDQSDIERARGFWSWSSFNVLNSVEVIGNLYETPELLEN